MSEPLAKLSLQVRPDARRVSDQVLADQDVEVGEGRRAPDGVARVGEAVSEGPELR